MTVAAVVLAAGGGTRFAGGSPKLLAPLGGRALVVWAVDAAGAAGLDEVIVVHGSIAAADLDPLLNPDLARPRVRLVANPRWAEGQATSLAAAVVAAEAAGHDAIVVALGDQPGVRPAAWRAVAAVAPTSMIAIATYDGRRGHPVRLPREVWPLLPVSGDQGARAVMAGRPDLVVEVACAGDPSDIDTVEDLAAFTAALHEQEG